MATGKTVKDVSPHDFVKAYASHLKRSGKRKKNHFQWPTGFGPGCWPYCYGLPQYSEHHEALPKWDHALPRYSDLK